MNNCVNWFWKKIKDCFSAIENHVPGHWPPQILLYWTEFFLQTKTGLSFWVNLKVIKKGERRFTVLYCRKIEIKICANHFVFAEIHMKCLGSWKNIFCPCTNRKKLLAGDNSKKWLFKKITICHRRHQVFVVVVKLSLLLSSCHLCCRCHHQIVVKFVM